MLNQQVNNATLHYTIIRFIVERGYAPEISELVQLLEANAETIVIGLRRLQEDHGVVLHPDGKSIWVIHPFALAPTNFLVRCDDREWWGNCAWCALGVAALLKRDVTITTTLGANDRQVDIQIKDGRLIETDFYVHFPVPMRSAWENVIYTCSTMLLFENESKIDVWCRQHRTSKGDVQPITKIWEFAKVWYGNHLNPEWRKWTAEEAKAIFDRCGLTGATWEIPVSEARF